MGDENGKMGESRDPHLQGGGLELPRILKSITQLSLNFKLSYELSIFMPDLVLVLT